MLSIIAIVLGSASIVLNIVLALITRSNIKFTEKLRYQTKLLSEDVSSCTYMYATSVGGLTDVRPINEDEEEHNSPHMTNAQWIESLSPEEYNKWLSSEHK